MFLLDTNTCIRFLHGRSPEVRNRLRQHSPAQLKLCSVVKAELLYGAAKSNHPERNRTFMEDFFAGFESYPFDDQAGLTYASIRRDLAREGKLIGPNDLLIAAIAISRSATLVTHNTREFSRVSGLRIEDWESPQSPQV
jgi:tRNA(fMet)-specific endonuclease VapC